MLLLHNDDSMKKPKNVLPMLITKPLVLLINSCASLFPFGHTHHFVTVHTEMKQMNGNSGKTDYDFGVKSVVNK